MPRWRLKRPAACERPAAQIESGEVGWTLTRMCSREAKLTVPVEAPDWGKAAMLLPLLSEKDEAVNSEGSLDPLGLFPIADELALRLIPGVRERQQHPRFLTVIAASLAVCQEFDDDRVAKDGVSEPWQVFEWHVVEGLVRDPDAARLRGLPGSDKARQAIAAAVPLSAKRYLKTPTVFGLHGVYRLLARNVRVEWAGRLGDFGVELIHVWSEEQRLSGFIGSSQGAGAMWRARLRDAVREGLDAGRVDRSPAWSGWAFFSKHLAIDGAGVGERRILMRGLTAPEQGHRRNVLEFLMSGEGRSLWKNGSRSERQFHAALKRAASPDLAALLSTIMAYEAFSTLMADAFDDCLKRMSDTRQKTPPGQMRSQPSVVKAAKELPDVYAEVRDQLGAYGLEARFEESFSRFADALGPQDFVEELLNHHRSVQARKPPAGKTPWFERFDDGSCVIRPGYLRGEGGRQDGEYLHAYRTNSLWSFLCDLGQV